MLRRVAVCALLLGLLPAAAHGSGTQESLVQDDDMLMYSGPARADATLAELDGLGVDRVRISLHWANVAPERRADLKDPTDPAAYDPSEFDAIDHLVRQVQRHNISVLLTVTGPAPAWAGGIRRPDRLAYSQFVEMVGRRWSGTYRDENQGRGVLPRISAWTLWNEPNWHNQLMPQWVGLKGGGRRAYVPRLYRSLYRAAVEGLGRSGHGNDTILLGDTAPLGSKGRNEKSPMRPVTFLRELFCLHADGRSMTGASYRRRGCDFHKRGPLKATGYAHHPYPITVAPGTPGKDPLGLILGDSARLGTILDQAAAAGRLPAGLPFWFTEFGYQTRPPDPITGVSLANQAAFLNQAERQTWADPRVAVHGQFLLRDDEPRNEYPEGDRRRWVTWQSGLRLADGSPKPAYESYRLPFYAPPQVAPDQTLELWGMVRPADGGTQRVTIQRRANPNAAWETIGEVETADPKGYFTTKVTSPQPGEYRFLWTPPRESPLLPVVLGRPSGAPVASAPVPVHVG
jgi:hypothetical protein